MQENIFQKEQKFRIRFGKHSVTLIASILIIKSLSIISTKVLTNFLPKVEYGIYIFWITFILFISGFCTSVFSASIWRYLAENSNIHDPSRKSRLFTLSFIGSFFGLIIVFFLILSAFIFTGFVLIEANDYLLALLIFFVVSSLYVIKELVLVLSGAEQNSREILYFNLSFGIMVFAGSCIAAFLQSNHLFVLIGVAIGFSIPITIAFLVKLYQYRLSQPTMRDIRKVFKYGGPRMGMRFFKLLTPFLSIFFVSIWLGNSEVATLSVGFSIAAILSMVLDSFLITYRPYMTNSYEEGAFNKANRITTLIIELFLVLTFPIIFGMITLSPLLVEIISTLEYLDAVIIVPFTIISSFLISLSYYWLVRIDLSEKTYLSAIIYFIAFLVLSISSVIFIPSLKLLGVGIALVAHSLVVLLLTFYVGNKLMKINLKIVVILKLVLSQSVGVTVFLIFQVIGFPTVISLAFFSIFYALFIFWTRALTFTTVKKVVNHFLNR